MNKLSLRGGVIGAGIGALGLGGAGYWHAARALAKQKAQAERTGKPTKYPANPRAAAIMGGLTGAMYGGLAGSLLSDLNPMRSKPSTPPRSSVESRAVKQRKTPSFDRTPYGTRRMVPTSDGGMGEVTNFHPDAPGAPIPIPNLQKYLLHTTPDISPSRLPQNTETSGFLPQRQSDQLMHLISQQAKKTAAYRQGQAAALQRFFTE